MNLDFQRLQSIKTTLDQKPPLRIHDQVISMIPVSQQQQSQDEEDQDLCDMVERFLSRKNFILSAKVSNIDFLLNEALNAMQQSTKIHGQYKTLSSEQMVLLLNSSKTVINTICRQMDEQFKGNIKRQLSSSMNTICAQYYHSTRAKERAAMTSQCIQTVEVKNGLSIRTLQMKIENLRKDLGQRVIDNQHLTEQIIELKEEAENAKITLNTVTKQLQEKITELERGSVDKGEKIKKLQHQLEESNTKLKSLQTKGSASCNRNSSFSRQNEFSKTTGSRFSRNNVEGLKNSFNGHRSSDISDLRRYGVGYPDQITEGACSESEDQYPKQIWAAQENKSVSSWMKKKGSNKQKNSIRRETSAEKVYAKLQQVDLNTEAHQSLQRASQLLSSANTLTVLPNLKNRTSERISNILQNMTSADRHSTQPNQHLNTTDPISQRKILNTSRPQVNMLSPSQQQRSSSMQKVQNTDFITQNPRPSTLNKINEYSPQRKISNLTGKVNKRLSGIDMADGTNVIYRSDKAPELSEAYGVPSRRDHKMSATAACSPSTRSSHARVSVNTFQIKNAQQILTKVNANLTPKNSIEVYGYNSLSDFSMTKKNKFTDSKPQFRNSTPKKISESKHQVVDTNIDRLLAVKEEFIEKTEKENIPQNHPRNSPEKSKISIQTVELLNSKFLSKFSKLTKESKKHMKEKSHSRKKQLKQIVRDYFDMEDISLFIGVSQAYQFEQSNQQSLDQSISKFLPPKTQAEIKYIYEFLESLKKSSPAFYNNVKNFLKHPYQTAVSKLCEDNHKEVLSYEKFQDIMIKLLVLHQKCPIHNNFYCEHIQGFFFKIGYRTQIQNAICVRPLFPNL